VTNSIIAFSQQQVVVGCFVSLLEAVADVQYAAVDGRAQWPKRTSLRTLMESRTHFIGHLHLIACGGGGAWSMTQNSFVIEHLL
jgi:hypothetical protein